MGAGQLSDIPPPPPGFSLDDAPAKPKKRGIFGRKEKIKIAPVDGDTAGVKARMLGVDAFERSQTGIGYDGQPLPIGTDSAAFLSSQLGPDTQIDFVPGQSTYGRAVATFNNNGKDVGAELLRAGQGVVVPEYLKNDPERLKLYQAAQNEAVQSKAGAWAGSFRTPSDYRQYQKTGTYPAGPLGITIDSSQFGPDGSITYPAQNDAESWKGNVPVDSLKVVGTNDSGVPVLNLSGFDGPIPVYIDTDEGRQALIGLTKERDASGKEFYSTEYGLDNPKEGDGWKGKRSPSPFWRYVDNRNSIENVSTPTGWLPDGLQAPAERLGLSMGLIDPSTYYGLGNYGNDAVKPDSPTVNDNPAPRTNWQIFKDTASEMATEAGGGVNSFVLRANRVERENDLIRQRLSLGLITPEQAKADIARNAQTRANLILNKRGAAAAFAADDERRQPDQSLGGWLKRRGAEIGGNVVGDVNPTYLIAPGANALQRIGSQAAVNGATDAALQGLEMGEGIQDGFDWRRLGINTAAGALLQGAVEIPGVIKGKGQADIPTDALPDMADAPDALPDMGGAPDASGNIPAAPPPQGAPVQWMAKPPAPPPGFKLDPPETVALNDVGLGADETIQSDVLTPPRQPDVIDVRNNARPMLQPPTEAQLQAQGQRIAPSDVTPIPSNEVGSLDEIAKANEGLYSPLPAPNENAVLSSRTMTSASTGNALPKRGPVDLVTWLRTKGGIQDQGGELSSIGVSNSSRDLEFAKGEARFGPVINEQGMTLDDAALRAWEAGYFPDHAERPTVAEFLDAVDNTNRGTARAFLPDDYAEIDAFEAARQQRQAVEKAQDAGNPLYVDKGEPATLADLEANQPPVQAYEEWPAGGPDFAGNIRLDKLETPQDIKRALVQTQSRVGFDAATRGRVTQAETQRLANELGMTADDLLTRRKGQALNAEEALAARQILAKSGNELVNLARRVQRLDNPGDELLAEFQQAWVRHVSIQEQVSGMTAEAGRTLAQFKMLADSRNVPGQVLAAKLGAGGGPRRITDAAEMIVDAADNDPGKVNALSRDAMKPKLKDKLIELWYNSLLSGPQTHVVNMVSNTMTAVSQLPEHGVAAAVGAFRQVLPNAKSDRVLFSELGARGVGLMAGTREGLKQAARSFRTGEPLDAVTKVEAQSTKAISGLKGEIIRIPTRALTAEDELFKAMARRMELHGLAIRKAKQEGLRGKAARDRAADLVANPSDEMLERAFDYGRYLTFQRALGPAASKIAAFTEAMPVAKLILPFVRTPTNLLKFSIERSPFAPLLKEWRSDFKAGGAKRDLAIAKSMVGTGIGLTIAELAQQGLITGGPPADRGREAMLRANGWQPYSAKIDGKYYSYSRLDPFSTTIGIAADLATNYDGLSESQREDAGVMLVTSIMAQLSNKTWLSGVSDMMEAVNDPQRYAAGFLKRLTGSLTVPTGVNQIARSVDPVARQRDSYGDAIANRVPGLSDNLYPQRDVLGREIVSEGGVGPDILSPIWESTDKNDPVLEKLIAARININKPQRDGLPAKDWDAYQERVGKLSRPVLNALVTNPEWDKLSQGEKLKTVRKVMQTARKDARAELFGGKLPEGKKASIAPQLPDIGNALMPKANASAPDKSDVYNYLLRNIPGVEATSGFRTPDYQADMRARGYRPADNSGHLNGSDLDLKPPPGKSLGWLKGKVRSIYPDAYLLDEGDHLHGSFPGYFQAPVLGGAKSWGLKNPNANMPPPPAGFTLDR